MLTAASSEAYASSVALVAARMGVAPERVVVGSVQQRQPTGRYASSVVTLARHTALYLAMCSHNIHLRELARVAHLSPEGVRKAVAAIEDRRDDPKFDAVVSALEEELVA